MRPREYIRLENLSPRPVIAGMFVAELKQAVIEAALRLIQCMQN
jgi:hypothetical protein